MSLSSLYAQSTMLQELLTCRLGMSPAQFQVMRERKLSVGCRYLKLCHTREELGRLPQGPKLVLATLPSLQAGMARDLFVEWAVDPRNLILFTQQAEVRPNHLVFMFCSQLLLIPAMACTMLCTFRSGQAIKSSEDSLHSIIRCIWARYFAQVSISQSKNALPAAVT
jgi:hypothetical protein